MSKEKYVRIERKEGIKYSRCQHLKEGSQKSEYGAWWIGEKERVVVCPLCSKMHRGNMFDYVYAIVKELNIYFENEKNKETK